MKPGFMEATNCSAPIHSGGQRRFVSCLPYEQTKIRNCSEITCAVYAGCFFECKDENVVDAGIDEAFRRRNRESRQAKCTSYFVTVPNYRWRRITNGKKERMAQLYG